MISDDTAKYYLISISTLSASRLQVVCSASSMVSPSICDSRCEVPLNFDASLSSFFHDHFITSFTSSSSSSSSSHKHCARTHVPQGAFRTWRTLSKLIGEFDTAERREEKSRKEQQLEWFTDQKLNFFFSKAERWYWRRRRRRSLADYARTRTRQTKFE